MNMRTHASLGRTDFISLQRRLVESLGSMVWGSVTLFLVKAVLIYVPTKGAKSSLFLQPGHLLSLLLLIIAILTVVRFYFIVILICTSLIITDVEYFFTYLLAIYIYSEKCPSKSLPIFRSDYFVVLLLSSLYIFNTNSRGDVWLSNICSHSIAHFFTLSIVSSAAQKLFSLMWSHLSSCVSVVCAFVVIFMKLL